ncbi:MAG: site-specific integrase [Enhydrobacter sp.]|nr:site-specific integrase [Enhydrobacter sp.]
MSKSVASQSLRTQAGPSPDRRGADAYTPSLYTVRGARKYLNAEERTRFLAAVADLPRDHALFALTIAWTGARPSELLEVTPASFQIEPCILTLRTLKRRRHAMRELPLPPTLMRDLDDAFGLAASQRDPEGAHARLWPWCRQTAWRTIKHSMAAAGIVGAAACPRGLRHAFGVGTLQAGIPINMTQKWLGHSRLTTTAIYADACGEEERAIFSRWCKSISADAAPASPPELSSEAP